MKTKKNDLGEYIVNIDYDADTCELNVEVLDELGDIIESIHISNDDDDTSDKDIGFNLN